MGMKEYPSDNVIEAIGPDGNDIDLRGTHMGELRVSDMSIGQLCELMLAELKVVNAHLAEIRGDVISTEDVT